MSAMTSQGTGVSIVCPGADQRKHQSYASLAFVMGINRLPVDSHHKASERGKCFHLRTSPWMTQWCTKDIDNTRNVVIVAFMYEWTFSPQPESRGEFKPQPEYQIFTKMTQKEWLNTKISQMLPQESGSKRKIDTQQEYVWHLKTQPEGVPEVKKGGLKGGTSLLTLWQKECPLTAVWSLRWRHNGQDDVSNHQPHHCLLNCLFGRRSKKASKLRVTGFCAGNSPGTGEFPAQMASNAENVSIWWRHHGEKYL